MSTAYVPNGRAPLALRMFRHRTMLRSSALRKKQREAETLELPPVKVRGAVEASEPAESSAKLRLPLPKKMPVPRRPRRQREAAPSSPGPTGGPQSVPADPASPATGCLSARGGGLQSLLLPPDGGRSPGGPIGLTPPHPGGVLRSAEGGDRRASFAPAAAMHQQRTPDSRRSRIGSAQNWFSSMRRQGTMRASVTSPGTILARVLLGGSTPVQAREGESPGGRFALPDARDDRGPSGDILPAPATHGSKRFGTRARLRDDPPKLRVPSTMPFTEEEYLALRRQFEILDVSGTGDLTWAQLQAMSNLTGLHVDYRTFKLMDKDRSGTVDFEEMLRMFYPRSRKADLRWAFKHWGEPHEAAKAVEAAEMHKKVDWKESFDDETLAELREVFNLFCHGDGIAENEADGESEFGDYVRVTTASDTHRNPTAAAPPPPAAAEGQEQRLTHTQLCRMLRHNPWITVEDIDEVFETYGTSQRGTLNFEEYVLVMESAMAKGSAVGAQRKAVKYSFVDPPKPPPDFG